MHLRSLCVASLFSLLVVLHTAAQAGPTVVGKAGTWKPDLEIARGEVEQAAAEVRQIETNLARLTMLAPVDGTMAEQSSSGPVCPMWAFG